MAANVSLLAPPGVRRVDVETAAELTAALDREFSSADVLIMAAAPADFRPKRGGRRRSTGRRTGSSARPGADRGHPRRPGGARREGQTIVGFAAETSEGIDRARELERKGADAIVLNDVSRAEIGFESLGTKC